MYPQPPGMSNDSGVGFLTIRGGCHTIFYSMSAKDPILVLASGSPRRRDLLECAGVQFSVQPSGVREKAGGGQNPEEFTRRTARMKARAVAGRLSPETWILAADTTVVLDGTVLGKPRDEPDAARMLRLLSGRGHRVLTAVVLTQAGGGELFELLCETSVWFRPLDAAAIQRYLSTGEPMDKAGAYGIQGKGAVLVSSIEGSYTNVVGLPLAETIQLLQEARVWPALLRAGQAGTAEQAVTGGTR
jgi:septum formation protein